MLYSVTYRFYQKRTNDTFDIEYFASADSAIDACHVALDMAVSEQSTLYQTYSITLMVACGPVDKNGRTGEKVSTPEIVNLPYLEYYKQT